MRLDWNEDNLTTDHLRYEGKPALLASEKDFGLLMDLSGNRDLN
jgi:hypothetical protein